MIDKVKNIGTSDLVLDTLTLGVNDDSFFHPAVFTDKDIGKIIAEFNDGHIAFYYKTDLLGGDILGKQMNHLLNSTSIRGCGLPDSIEKWDKIGQVIGYDYKYVREQIALIAATKTNMYADWDNLSGNEKEIVCIHVAAPLAIVTNHFTSDELVVVLRGWGDASNQSRVLRWEAAKMFIFTSLEITDAKSVLVELTTSDNLVTRYLSGIEGTIEDDGQESLLDYVASRTGTSYASTGLVNKSFTPISGTMQDVSDGAMDILKNGIY